jgi:hypothetical protein
MVMIMNLKMIWNTVKLYMLWGLIHYITANLYQHYCAGRSFMGFVTSSFNTQMTHCKAIGWLQDVSVNTLNSYWAVMISFVVGKVTGVLGGVN